MANNELIAFLAKISVPNYREICNNLDILDNHVLLESIRHTIKTQNKATYLKNKDLVKFEELTQLTHRILNSGIHNDKKLQLDLTSYIYVKHLSDKNIRPSSTLMISGHKYAGAFKMFKNLQKLDVNDEFYVLCVGYGLISNNHIKNDKITYINYNSLDFGEEYNYDAEPFAGGSVKYKLSKNGTQKLESDDEAIHRENYEEIGRMLTKEYFQKKHIYRQNQKITYYFTTPKDYEVYGYENNNFKNPYDTQESYKSVKSIIYGKVDEMYDFLKTCEPTDNEEMISYYALIKLSELIKVYDKIGKKTVITIKYDGDKMETNIMPKFNIYN
jgi:hypothetical protein